MAVLQLVGDKGSVDILNVYVIASDEVARFDCVNLSKHIVEHILELCYSSPRPLQPEDKELDRRRAVKIILCVQVTRLC